MQLTQRRFKNLMQTKLVVQGTVLVVLMIGILAAMAGSLGWQFQPKFQLLSWPFVIFLVGLALVQAISVAIINGWQRRLLRHDATLATQLTVMQQRPIRIMGQSPLTLGFGLVVALIILSYFLLS